MGFWLLNQDQMISVCLKLAGFFSENTFAKSHLSARSVQIQASVWKSFACIGMASGAIWDRCFKTIWVGRQWLPETRNNSFQSKMSEMAQNWSRMFQTSAYTYFNICITADRWPQRTFYILSTATHWSLLSIWLTGAFFTNEICLAFTLYIICPSITMRRS